MTLDLNDPASIGRWVRVFPERHLAQLDGMRRLPLYQELKRKTDGASRGAPTAAAPATGPTSARDESQGALL